MTGAPLPSDAGLQLSVEQGSIVSLQIGAGDDGVANHPAPVCPAVTALYLVQPCHLFQAENILKALLEVVRQECVQDGVGTAVGIAKYHHEVEGAFHCRGGVDGTGDRGDIEKVER